VVNVVISRGELVQIGGGFRIPDVLESSGAHLREVGTTNQTKAADYARAINRETALILKVHRSNFFMEGFVESPSTEEIAVMAKRKKIPFVEDLGSGAIVQTAGYWRTATRADASRGASPRSRPRLFQWRQVVWRASSWHHRWPQAVDRRAQARTVVSCRPLRQIDPVSARDNG
jgi:hypothetical protein